MPVNNEQAHTPNKDEPMTSNCENRDDCRGKEEIKQALVETGVVPHQIAAVDIEDLESIVGRMEKYVNFFDRARKLCIRMTNKNDWSDQGGKPYMEATGASKIAGCLGVQVVDTTASHRAVTDDRGSYTIYETRGRGIWNNNAAIEVGIATTRDDFFAKRKQDGKIITLPESEVDTPSVIKKSHTNMMNRLIKRLAGLSFTWEEIEQFSEGRITRESVASRVGFQKGNRGGRTDQPSAQDIDRQNKLREAILRIVGGNQHKAKEWLIRATTFKGRDGQMVAGIQQISQLRGKRLEIALDKALKAVAAMEQDANEHAMNQDSETDAAADAAMNQDLGDEDPSF